MTQKRSLSSQRCTGSCGILAVIPQGLFPWKLDLISSSVSSSSTKHTLPSPFLRPSETLSGQKVPLSFPFPLMTVFASPFHYPELLRGGLRKASHSGLVSGSPRPGHRDICLDCTISTFRSFRQLCWICEYKCLLLLAPAPTPFTTFYIIFKRSQGV